MEEKRKLLFEKKAQMDRYMEDIEQVVLLGIERSDFEEKKALCRQLLTEIKQIEKELGEKNEN